MVGLLLEDIVVVPSLYVTVEEGVVLGEVVVLVTVESGAVDGFEEDDVDLLDNIVLAEVDEGVYIGL